MEVKTLFMRGDNGLVYDEIAPGAAWVIAGDGVATVKWDGIGVKMGWGKLYQWKGEWELVNLEAKENAPFRDAWHFHGGNLEKGTYELIGPDVKGNPYDLPFHRFAWHKTPFLASIPPRDFEGLKLFFLVRLLFEGVVWHHKDGRLVQIKREDFGYPWNQKGE